MNRNLGNFLAMLALLAAAPVAADPLAESRDCVIGPHTVVDVSSSVPGLLEQVSVERSDTVRAGQVLARLESGVERASLDLAQAWSSIDSEIRIEETSRALDHRRNDRISQLYASRAVALDDKDQAETEAALAALRLRQAREKRWIRELDARKAEATLERRTVRSPIDGVVVERFRAAGEYVENQPIARIAQLDPLQVETILPMALFGQVDAGMVAQVHTENAPGEALRAVVSVVDRMGDAASGTFGVRLSLRNPDNRIPAGLKCSLSFASGERAPVPATGRPVPGSDPAGGSPAAPVMPAPEAEIAPVQTRAPEVIALPPAAAKAPVAQPDPAAPATRAAVTPVTHGVAGAVTGPGESLQCAAIGPLDSAAEAGALAAAMSDAGAPARSHRESVTESMGFIVVTPEQADRDAAKRLADHIASTGVRDLQVMYRGEYVNRVSLGVYPDGPMAERRRAQVQALGVGAEVLERTRSREQWWVHAQLPGNPAETVSLSDVAGGRSLRPRPCTADGIRRAQLPQPAGDAS